MADVLRVYNTKCFYKRKFFLKGSEEHLKEVWEKEDHMDKESFNYKSFFNLHGK